MIVEWKKDTVKVIPARTPTKEDPVTSVVQVVLPPGYSEVSNMLWKEARNFVQEELTQGSLVEEWVKVTREEAAQGVPPELFLNPPDGSKGQIKIPAALSDINRPKVVEVVKACFHVPTLQKWKENENRHDVVKVIDNQIDGIETGAIKG